MTPEFAARMTPQKQRYLAIALLAAAVVLVLGIALGPIIAMHRPYESSDSAQLIDWRRSARSVRSRQRAII